MDDQFIITNRRGVENGKGCPDVTLLLDPIAKVIVADTTSATGSEKNAASAVKSAGRKISPARKINFRKAEQKSASFTLPRAVVSSTSGYCMASGMIIKVNRLI